MFALMSIETDDMHLRFHWDTSLPYNVRPERTTVVAAPFEQQFVSIHRYAEEALRIVFQIAAEKRERERAIMALRQSRQG